MMNSLQTMHNVDYNIDDLVETASNIYKQKLNISKLINRYGGIESLLQNDVLSINLIEETLVKKLILNIKRLFDKTLDKSLKQHININNIQTLIKHFQMTLNRNYLEFKVLYLNHNRELIMEESVDVFNKNPLKINLSRLLRKAIVNETWGMIFICTHPNPLELFSVLDYMAYNTLKKQLKILKIVLIDYLIITENSYYSFNNSPLQNL